MNDWMKAKFDSLRLTFENRCNDCGVCPYDYRLLHFAHIKPTELKGEGRGKHRRLFDIMKNPDCYFLCCPKKHAEIDGRYHYKEKVITGEYRYVDYRTREINK